MRRGRAVPGPLSMPSSVQAVTRSMLGGPECCGNTCRAAHPTQVERAATAERLGRPLTALSGSPCRQLGASGIAPLQPLAWANRIGSGGRNPPIRTRVALVRSGARSRPRQGHRRVASCPSPSLSEVTCWAFIPACCQIERGPGMRRREFGKLLGGARSPGRSPPTRSEGEAGDWYSISRIIGLRFIRQRNQRGRAAIRGVDGSWTMAA
jgi:hypothetical protein